MAAFAFMSTSNGELHRVSNAIGDRICQKCLRCNNLHNRNNHRKQVAHCMVIRIAGIDRLAYAELFYRLQPGIGPHSMEKAAELCVRCRIRRL